MAECTGNGIVDIGFSAQAFSDPTDVAEHLPDSRVTGSPFLQLDYDQTFLVFVYTRSQCSIGSFLMTKPYRALIVTVRELKFAEVALSMMFPGLSVACTITWAKPLNTDRDNPLSLS